jgi:DNA-binding GntR family transcriptional regulator
MRDMLLLPREQKENNREYAYRVLRENIVTLHFPPGEELNENAAAEALAISRTPVREALFALRKESMVDARPRNGSIVSLINLNALRQGIMMQVMVEMEIMRLLCGNLDDWLITQWRSNLEMQEEALAAPGGQRRYLRLDDEFHRLAYLAARKGNLHRQTKILASQLDRLRHLLFLEGKVEYGTGLAEHKEIYVRMIAGTYANFAALYLPHRMGVERYIPGIAAKYPEYFDAPSGGDGRMARLEAIIARTSGRREARG